MMIKRNTQTHTPKGARTHATCQKVEKKETAKPKEHTKKSRKEEKMIFMKFISKQQNFFLCFIYSASVDEVGSVLVVLQALKSSNRKKTKHKRDNKVMVNSGKEQMISN